MAGTQTQSPTLAQAVRAQYPAAYDDMDDATLENQVLAKYPEYSDMPRTPAAPNLKGLVGDSDFQKMDPASQRQALVGVTRDQSFGQLSDADTAQFISRMSGLGQTPTSGATGDWNSAPPNPYVQDAKDVAIGAGKGLLNTVSGVSTLLNKLPWVGEKLAPSAGVNAMKQIAQPTDTAQTVGKVGEQALEFMAPGLGEEDAGLAAAKNLPWLGKAAPVAGRVAAQSVGSGSINALQGGSFATGAVAGAGSGLLGEGIQAAAPKIAESALGVTQRMRGYGKTIGQAALDETSGITPGAIASQAGQRIATLTNQLESLTSASQTPASLLPAFSVLDDAEQVARARNSAARLAKINTIRDQLYTDITSGATIPQGPNAEVTPSKILDLKRGINELITSWAPQEQKGFQPIVQRVYGALDGELDRTVPGAQDINQKLSSLIPAKKRAAVLSDSAPISQRIAGRLARPTGALIGSGIGGTLGYREDGIPGALAGGAAGLVLPEVLSSPTTQMLAARGAQNAVPYTLPWMRGLALQADRTGQNRNQLPWVSQ